MRGNRGFGLIHLFIFLCVFIFFLFTIVFLVHKTGLDSKNNLLSPTYQYPTNSSNSTYDNNNSSRSSSSTDSIDNIDYDYTSIEKQLKTAAALYQGDLYPEIDKDDVIRVTAKKLIALDYLPNLTDGRVSCDGYATITYKNYVIVDPYIKCGSNYKTKGYEAKYAK